MNEEDRIEIVDIRAEEVYVTLKLGMKAMRKLRFALSRAEIKVDLSIPLEKEANSFLVDSFYPTIDAAIRSVEKDGA